MNENEIFRLKGRIAISNLSREDKNMINSILDGVNKKDEKSKTGPTFEDLKRELDDVGVKNDDYSNNGTIIINRIVMSGEEFDRFIGEE